MPAVRVTLFPVGRSGERGVFHYALPGCSPHVAHVQIRTAVVIVVEPGGAHSRAYVFHSRLRRHVTKPAPFILVQVVPPEVIGYIKVRPTVAVIVAPGGRKTVTVVVMVHSGAG